MPAFVKHEESWEKAKSAARSAGFTEKDGDKFWSYVTGVYKKIEPGDIKKQSSSPFLRMSDKR